MRLLLLKRTRCRHRHSCPWGLGVRPPTTMPRSVALQGSPAEPPISAGVPPSQSGPESLGLLPQPSAQQAAELDHQGPFPPFGYVPLQAGAPQPPPEQLSTRQASAGDASVSSADRWNGYDASGSLGHHNSSGSGSGVASGGQPAAEVRLPDRSLREETMPQWHALAGPEALLAKQSRCARFAAAVHALLSRCP